MSVQLYSGDYLFEKNPGHFKQLFSVFLILLFVLSGSAEPAGNPKPKDPVAINWEDLQQEAVDLLVQYLRIDTTNPPGNEIKAAGFFAEICKREGIEHRVFEPFPGRGILWARIKGDGSRRPVILLNHTDVVPHSPDYWTVDPFRRADQGWIHLRSRRHRHEISWHGSVCDDAGVKTIKSSVKA